MNPKLIQVYTYLSLKQIYNFEEKVAKMIWLADKRHLTDWGSRTVTGRPLPVAILPDLEPDYTAGEDGLFGELSRSDIMVLDEVFLLFESLTDEQIAGMETKEFTSLEEVYEGVEHAEDMIADIRENEAIRLYFQSWDNENMLPIMVDLKRAAKLEYGSVHGVHGFGIHEGALLVYVEHEAVKYKV